MHHLHLQAAKTHHPDVSGRSLDKEAFLAILTSYETLSSPEKRRLHDLALDGAAPNFVRAAARRQSHSKDPGSSYDASNDQHGRHSSRGANRSSAAAAGVHHDWRWGAMEWASRGPAAGALSRSGLGGSGRVARFLDGYQREVEVALYEALVYAYLGPRYQ